MNAATALRRFFDDARLALGPITSGVWFGLAALLARLRLEGDRQLAANAIDALTAASVAAAAHAEALAVAQQQWDNAHTRWLELQEQRGTITRRQAALAGRIDPAAIAEADQLAAALAELESQEANAIHLAQQANTDANTAATKAATAYTNGVPPPPADPHFDSGAGTWRSQPWYSRGGDIAFEAGVVRPAATAADSFGYENAARHLRHYLNNSGEDLDVDPALIARDNPKFAASVNQQLSEEVEDAIRRASGQAGTPVQFSSDWKGVYLDEDRDWFLALGGMSHAVTGYAVVSPTNPSQVEVHYETHVFDRYNWDEGKGVNFGPVSISDDQMGALHTAGIAKEYSVRGSTDEQVQIATAGGDGSVDLGDDPVAEQRDGTRSDPGRDRQRGRERTR
jgi:hypothetical protein